MNHRVREILAANNTITTVAGNGRAGHSGDGGLATQAALDSPDQLAVDSKGNLFINDGSIVREVLAGTGVITTVAGTGIRGSQGDNGLAIRAELDAPSGLAVDGAGNLLITEGGRVREVNAGTGMLVTVAGTGGESYGGDGGVASKAELAQANGAVLDATGNLFIADGDHIREVHANTHIITTVAGNGTSSFSGDGGPATKAGMHPEDVAIDTAGNLFILDFIASRVREVHVGTGIITTTAGNGTLGYSGDGGPATRAAIEPTAMVVDGAGNLIIADETNNRVREVHAGTGLITTVAGTGRQDYTGDGGPATKAALDSPVSLALDAKGDLFISGSHAVREVHVDSGVITTIAGTGDPDGEFSGDGGPAVDANIDPFALAVDSAGNLYMTDGDDRIREVRAGTGIIRTVVGTGVVGYSGDGGPAIRAELDEPASLAIDAAGNLYIADAGSNRIRVVWGIAAAS
jgi:trimeric autotransporter adhesin